MGLQGRGSKLEEESRLDGNRGEKGGKREMPGAGQPAMEAVKQGIQNER